MCTKHPHSLDELKQNIQNCILNVTSETVHQIASYIKKRVDADIAERSGHFQHLLSDFNCNSNCRIKILNILE